MPAEQKSLNAGLKIKKQPKLDEVDMEKKVHLPNIIQLDAIEHREKTENQNEENDGIKEEQEMPKQSIHDIPDDR